MLPNANEFQIKSDGIGFRMTHKVTGKQLGEYFQEACRSVAWKSALIIYEKYKRKWNLEHKDLILLRRQSESFMTQRETAGKKCNADFLVQELSAFAKKNLTPSEVSVML